MENSDKLQCVVVFLFGSFLSLPQASTFTACWFHAPHILETTVRQEIEVIPTRISETRNDWRIESTVTWGRPSGFQPGTHLYVVSLRKIEEEVKLDDVLCELSENESVLETERMTFTNLSFGFVYEFKLFTYDSSSSKKSLSPTTMAFQTPDCYQATNDTEFCSTVDVQYSGAPRDPLLEYICRNDTSVAVTFSWLPPIQVNGDLSFFNLRVISASEEGNFGTAEDSASMSISNLGDYSDSFGPGHEVTVPFPAGYRDGDKITKQISSLEENEYYYLTITPIVSIQTGGDSMSGSPMGNIEMHPGIEVEMNFFTDSGDSASEIPPCDVPPSTSQSTNPRVTTTVPMVTSDNIVVNTTPTTPATPNETTPLTSRVTTNGRKVMSPRPGKTKDTNKNSHRKTQGVIKHPNEKPITPIGIVIVVLATLVVTILVITTLVVGVHYMRGVAPESPSKLGPTNGSRRSNGRSTGEENGTPLKENV